MSIDERNEMQIFRRGNLAAERRALEVSPPEYLPAVRELPDLRRLAQIVWTRRHVALAVIAVVLLGAVTGILLTDRVYRATGLLEIRRESADVVPLDTLFNVGTLSDEYMETQYGILRSDQLAQRVIEQMKLAEAPEFQPAAGWLSGTRSEPKPEDLREAFQSRLIVDPLKGSRLVRVSFEAKSPELAAGVVNSILSNYIDLRVEEGQKASEWLGKQLNATKEKLEESEERLRKYVQANGLQLLETEGGGAENLVNDRMRQLQEELTRAQAARYEREAQARFVRDWKNKQSLDHLENPVLQSLTVRLAELKREYAQLMTVFRPDYPRAKEVQNQISEIEGQIQTERQRAATRVSREYLSAVQREKLLHQALENHQALANQLATKSAGYNTLRRDVETNKQLYGVLQQKLKEVGVSTALKATNVGIVDPAALPREPERPKVALNLLIAAMLAVLLGVSATFVQEHIDTRVRTVEEAAGLLGLPAVGMIPSAQALGGSQSQKLLSSGLSTLGIGRSGPSAPAGWYRLDQDPRESSALANAFASLRTAILFHGAGEPPRSILVTSSRPGEGKTTVSVNLALSLAKLGKRVLLVDADARCPAVHQILRLNGGPGLVAYLAGNREWRDLLCRDVYHGLDVLPAGKPAADSTELFSSIRLKNLLAEARESYDFVILDSPALFINLSDARILSAAAEGVLFVVRSGSTPREVAIRALDQVDNVIGFVLNDLDVDLLPAYYREYYGARPTAQSGHARPASGRIVRVTRPRTKPA